MSSHLAPNSMLTLFAAASLASAQTACPVSFDWFEYSGKDPSLAAEAGAGKFHNPILAGFYPDPSICRVGDDFYLANSTFAYFPGIPIFHSKDLVNWKLIGHAIHRPEQLNYDGLDVSAGLWAPTIRFHDGKFYMICTHQYHEENFLVTADHPDGPWSDPVMLGFKGCDPSLFFDDDGRVWVVNSDNPEGEPRYKEHKAVRLQEFDLKRNKMVGPRDVIVNGGVDISKKPRYVEGPHIFKRADWYYLICAEGGTELGHSEVVFRSRKVGGPYEPWSENPIVTQRDLDPGAPNAVTCTGHADFVIGPDDNWWVVFLACRPYDREPTPMGRETFMLPVKWTDDGWPMVLKRGEPVPLTVDCPKGVSVKPDPKQPLNGSFTWRDEFEGEELSPLWGTLRVPKEKWWKLNASSGRLLLTPRAEPLTGTGNPSYLARRVQHSRFTASASLDVPEESGVSAGLTVFQNQNHHYFLAVRKGKDGASVFLERVKKGVVETLASAPLADASKVDLRIVANDAKCAFEYNTDATAKWVTLVNDADATMFTTAVAGGFVGATVGPHVRSDGMPK